MKNPFSLDCDDAAHRKIPLTPVWDQGTLTPSRSPLPPTPVCLTDTLNLVFSPGKAPNPSLEAPLCCNLNPIRRSCLYGRKEIVCGMRMVMNTLTITPRLPPRFWDTITRK
jgi:hypothetical protein